MMETYDLVVSLVFLDADIKEKLSYRFFFRNEEQISSKESYIHFSCFARV